MTVRVWRVCATATLFALGCEAEVLVGTNDDAAIVPSPEITWLSGAHAGNELQDYIDFGAWRGRPLGLAQVFTDRTGGWVDVVTPGWPVDMLATFPGQLVISQPLYPEGQGNNNQDCAAGLYDVEWQRFGTFLVERDRADAIVRLGWGFNDGSHEWRADADLTDWLTCFRRVVDAIRSTDPQARIDWSFDGHGAPDVALGDPFLAYPGDDHVDFVGVEIFDRYPATRDEVTWDAKCSSETGLCRVFDFARSHGKQVGIAEWGAVSCGDGASLDMGGDNPFFVQKVVETFAANSDALAYEAYFEDGSLDVCSNLMDADKPNAAAKYQELYRVR